MRIDKGIYIPIADQNETEAKKYANELVLKEILKKSEIPEELKEKIRNKEVKILDIGTGRGLLVDYLSKEGYQICGIDYQNLEPENTENKLIADADKLPFTDESFDIIVMIGCIDPYIYQDQKFSKLRTISFEISRVLKKPGVLVTSNYDTFEDLKHLTEGGIKRISSLVGLKE